MISRLSIRFRREAICLAPGTKGQDNVSGGGPLSLVTFKGLKRWDEGRWGTGNKPQYSTAYT